MKKIIQHINVLLLLAMVMLCACNRLKKPETNWKISLKKEGKNPYDTYLAYHSLDYYFPNATIKPLFSNHNFADIVADEKSSTHARSMLVLTGKFIYFSQKEWDGIVDFIRAGNEVLMLGSATDEKIAQQFHFKHHSGKEDYPITKYNTGADNETALSLTALPNQRFGIWGRDLKGYFELENYDKDGGLDSFGFAPLDYGKPLVLGNVYFSKTNIESPNFIQYTVGAGHLTLLATPLVFSNYFLLQENNHAYLDQVWQSIPKSVQQIYWGSFYQRMPSESSFSILWKNPATRLAIIIFMLTAVFYLIFEMKRRQRIIPVIPQQINSSAAFIETIGMLYFNKGDNLNLAIKMEQHFLEWVRTKFNFNTTVLNDVFAHQLSVKSGMGIDSVNHLLNMIHQVRLNEGLISDEFLFDLYNTIQQFYKNN